MDGKSLLEQWLGSLVEQLEQLGHRVDLYTSYAAGQLSLDPLALYGILFAILAGAILLLHRYKQRGGRWTQRYLQAMNDRSFEELLASLWKEMGYHTVITPPGRDQGIDVLATKKQLLGLLGSKRVAIQAKRYGPNHKVTAEEVMQYASIPLRTDVKIKAVVIVTSSEFTGPALKLGRSFRTIEALVDAPQLVKLLNAHLHRSQKRPNSSGLIRFNLLASQVILWASIVVLLLGLAMHMNWMQIRI